MIRQIIHIWILGKQFGSAIEIHANEKRTRFGRRIGRDASQKFAMDLERWDPVGDAPFHAGQRKRDLSHRVECAYNSRPGREFVSGPRDAHSTVIMDLPHADRAAKSASSPAHRKRREREPAGPYSQSHPGSKALNSEVWGGAAELSHQVGTHSQPLENAPLGRR